MGDGFYRSKDPTNSIKVLKGSQSIRGPPMGCVVTQTSCNKETVCRQIRQGMSRGLRMGRKILHRAAPVSYRILEIYRRSDEKRTEDEIRSEDVADEVSDDVRHGFTDDPKDG